MLALDLGQVYNGPYCGLLLGFMGARVIKIEPPEGHVVRRRKRDVEPYPLVMLNSNKESVVLDLKHPRGKALFLRLAEQASSGRHLHRGASGTPPPRPRGSRQRRSFRARTLTTRPIPTSTTTPISSAASSTRSECFGGNSRYMTTSADAAVDTSPGAHPPTQALAVTAGRNVISQCGAAHSHERQILSASAAATKPSASP
jgi:hypothetical protein